MLIPLYIALVACALVGIGAVYQWRGAKRDAKRFPAPGGLYDIGGGVKLHADIAGSGKPVVVFEAGISATSLSWRAVHREVARWTTVCSYDRAGLGWSSESARPRTPSNIAVELKALLDAARLPGPYVLVGHSFGGLCVQRFASMYPEATAGLVLVDPLAASEWTPMTDARRRTLGRGIMLSRRGATLARIGVVRACISLVLRGNRLAPKLAGRMSSGQQGSGFLDRIAREIGKLPPEVWPFIAAQWCSPKSFHGMIAHLENLPASAEEMTDVAVPDVPAVVIVAGKNNGAGSDPAPALPKARRVVAENSGHWVQLDEPELVIQAIRDITAERPA